ncbi:ABC transporter [Truncatella angustata]|uniref:ABC transporter n=1 Tax=Truncatella angustata TaxID=152316 RepID=A0A9P8UW95_9PEZI|nr:ABC transporter [Truncatella angustata]KAH6659515.1 ABC transporter [Truncatella angustata]
MKRAKQASLCGQMNCTLNADRSFGPRTEPGCRSFDFTLLFEDLFFACLPAALFIALSPWNFVKLLRRPALFSLSTVLLASKLVTLTALFAVQLAFLALRVAEPVTSTSASIAADVLSSIATVVAVVLAVLDRQRAPRPSTLLTLYLSSAVLLGVARVRTLWLLAAYSTVSALMIATFALTCVALLYESAESRTDLITTHNLGKNPRAPEEVSGFWIRTCFTWLASTFRRGYSRIISIDDLPHLDSELRSSGLGERLASKWVKRREGGRYRLLRACLESYFFSFASPIIPRLCLTAFTFSQPLLINTTVTFVGYRDPDANYGKGLIGAWALVSLGIAASSSVYNYQNFRFTTRLRGGLIALVYQRALGTRDVDAGEVTAVALLGADVERIKACMGALHEVWASLLDITIASWLLGVQLSVACLAPIVLVLAFIAATTKVSLLSRTAQMKWIEKVQARLRITTSLLSNMKSIKMSGLEQVMRNIMQATRADEINTSSMFRKLLVATLTLSLAPINLAPVVTFAIYVIISVFWKNGTLLPAQAFTSIALVSILTVHVVVFIQVLPQVIQCLASFDRIQEFCSYGENSGSDGPEYSLAHGDPENKPDGKSSSLDKNGNAIQLQQQDMAVSFSGECFAWDKNAAPNLTELNVEFPIGTISAIVGPVGSGKSSILRAMLGEMICTTAVSQTDAKRRREIGGIAYCSQEPWLENTSIRQNIIGASPLDEKWYATVKTLCGLDSDIAQTPRGDDMRIGSQGLNLSGGQKQRIALARAIYARHKLVVLDDVFSGMDAHTAETVSLRLLGPQGILRNAQTTVVIASHNRKVIALVDRVIALRQGKIAEITRPAAILQDEDTAGNLGAPTNSHDDASENRPDAEATEAPSSGDPQEHLEIKEDGATMEVDGSRKKADFTVYKYYLANAGYAAILCYVVAVVAWIFCTEFSTVWINWWSEANTVQVNQDVGFYIGIYTMLGVLGTVGAASAAWVVFTSVISNTGTNFHSQLLEATLSAPLRFFTNTDSGELLNRFSQDMELIDMELPAVMVNYTSTVVSIIAKAIVLAVFSQYLGIAIPFLGGAMYLLQSFYLHTSRQVRLLDIEAKAPLYTLFSESVAGAPTIRAFGWQDEYQRRNHRHIDTSQRPLYLQNCIQAWLAFVLSIMVAALTVVLVAIVVTWHDSFSPGSIGVSLTVVIGFSETLSRVIETWTKLESSLGAVRRVKQFTDQTEPENTNDKNEDPPQGWPPAGAIEFDGVTASYRRDDQSVLKNVSLPILPGQHVAICGRTGSGKTSLILSLLRMISVDQGKINIDNVDTSAVRRSTLRHIINVVPQDPLWIPGTIRANVDPFHVAPDDAIVRAIIRVGLGSLLEAHGIDKVIDVSVLSTGQRQLLCFARAMIKTSKILVLDEAMSSVDAETEAIMQDIIDTEFKDCTVIAVMHRLQHVARYDKVALMENGVLLEFDGPGVLMAKKTRFAELYKSYTT